MNFAVYKITSSISSETTDLETYKFLILKGCKINLFTNFLFDKIIACTDSTNLYLNTSISDSEILISSICNHSNIDIKNCMFVKFDSPLTEGAIITDFYNLINNVVNIYPDSISKIYNICRMKDIYAIILE